MPQKCQICMHQNKLDMEREYMKGHPVSQIAKTYEVPDGSLYNHVENHLSRQLVQAYQQKEMDESMDILGGIDDLLKKTRKILEKAEAKGKDRLALSAIKEARGSYELLSKIAYALHQAKVSELEAERLRNNTDQDQAKQEAMESLQVLTDDELKVYERLTRKLRTQDHDLECLPKHWQGKEFPEIDLEWEPTTESYEVVDRYPSKSTKLRRTNPPKGSDDFDDTYGSDIDTPDWLKEHRQENIFR